MNIIATHHTYGMYLDHRMRFFFLLPPGASGMALSSSACAASVSGAGFINGSYAAGLSATSATSSSSASGRTGSDSLEGLKRLWMTLSVLNNSSGSVLCDFE